MNEFGTVTQNFWTPVYDRANKKKQKPHNHSRTCARQAFVRNPLWERCSVCYGGAGEEYRRGWTR